jgi:microcystin-dependent protein
MGDLIVKPAYKFGPKDILDADKLNLLATPVVELALTDPVNDQNFFRNGNFYSSFWTTPAGISCPVNVWTTNASYWLCRPNGAAVQFLRSSTVPDQFSLFTAVIVGAASAALVEFGQQINGDLSATLRRKCTFSGYILNNTGLTLSPTLNIYTCNAFNNFAAITLQTSVNLQTGTTGAWTYCTATIDLSLLANVANGLLIAIAFPAGSLNASTKSVYLSRLKFQIGEVATEFVDDPSLFVQTPSVDSTMLQDGCIARSTLFLPNVVPTGSYQAKSIYNGDISDGAINSRTLVPSANTTLSAGFTQPAVSSTVSIAVVSTAGFLATQPIAVVGGGYYIISSVTDATHMVVTNAGLSGNVSPGTTVPTGGSVSQASAAQNNLGYTPVNKAGDSGVGSLYHTVDTVVAQAYTSAPAISVQTTPANSPNTGYYPAIGFSRPGTAARILGLSTTRRFQTVDDQNLTGYLLDTITGVDTNSYQDGSITYQKLAQSLVNLIIPSGIISMFSGPNLPAGWIFCDGHAYLASDYPALFSAIGTYWGNGGDVSGAHFQVPNFVNRVPVGYGTGAHYGFASYAGEETHALSVGEMPNHAHSINDQQHSHTMNAHHHSYINPVGGTGSQPGSGQYSAAGTTNTSDATSTMLPSWTNITGTNAAGGNIAHNNMQPFAVLYYIIKA